MTRTKPAKIALFGQLPPQVTDAVSAKAKLIPLADITPEHATEITLGLTSAMIGASDAVLSTLPNLKTLVSCGAGLDRFDFSAIDQRGIDFHHTGALMTRDTAEMAVTLVFALLRRIVPNDAHVRLGAWAKGRPEPAVRVAGKRIGIVGLGQIGRCIAQMLDALGLSVSYTGPNPKTDVPWPYQPDLHRLSRDVDVLILSCAGGAPTRHLVTASVLDALGPEGYLINVARGSVVNETALIKALETGAIAGAALDVFENEPTPDPRFSACKTLVLQPHAATLTTENRAELVAEVLRRLGLSS